MVRVQRLVHDGNVDALPGNPLFVERPDAQPGIFPVFHDLTRVKSIRQIVRKNGSRIESDSGKEITLIRQVKPGDIIASYIEPHIDILRGKFREGASLPCAVFLAPVKCPLSLPVSFLRYLPCDRHQESAGQKQE